MEDTIESQRTDFDDMEDAYYAVLDKNGNSIAVQGLPAFFGSADQAAQFAYSQDPSGTQFRIKVFDRYKLLQVFRDGFQIMYREATAGPTEPFVTRTLWK